MMMLRSITYCIAISIFLSGGVLVSRCCGAFVLVIPTARTSSNSKQQHQTFATPNNKQQQDSGGYKFGDITKGLINRVTGKQEYAFGDLSRWADSQVKDNINKVTGQDEYKLFDLSKWADAEAKKKVNEFTGKESYTVGDVSKEIIRRVGTGEYKVEDVVLLCKVLVTVGVGLTPAVACSLPAKLIVEMLEYGIAQEVGGRLIGALANVLDERFKEAITGDPNYRIGDKTKSAVADLLAKATAQTSDATTKSASSSKDDVCNSEKEMDSALVAELDDWDRRLGIPAAGTISEKSNDGRTPRTNT